MVTRPSRWDPDTLAQLEQERDLLLRDLRELTSQHAAGEIDTPLFEHLRDELTGRAADTIALVERGKAFRPKRSSQRRTQVLTLAALTAAAVLAGLLMTDQLAPRVQAAPPVAKDAEASSRLARLASVVAARPDDVPARLALARFLLQEQDFDEALAHFDAVTDVESDHAEALAYAGWLATLGGDTDGGLDRLNRAVAADRTYPDAHALRGLALMRAGERDAAVEELRLYLELAPGGPLSAQVEAVITRLDGDP